MQIKQLKANPSNYGGIRKKNIEYIVIHYTANNGDSALSNCKYFANNSNLNASAHYFVDDVEVYNSVEERHVAWHSGNRKNKYKHLYARNENSIGIELCSRIDSKGEYYFTQQVFDKAVELVSFLCKKHKIKPKNIVRHYDITGKICPAPFVKNEIAWNNFIKKVSDIIE